MNPATMNRAERRAAAKGMAAESKQWPAALVPVPPEDWPTRGPGAPLQLFRSREFLVQVFAAPAPAECRLSINRVSLAGNRWAEGITWIELQRLKAEAGFADRDAVEVFPAEADVVNVANMRHLWVMATPLEFAWRHR